MVWVISKCSILIHHCIAIQSTVGLGFWFLSPCAIQVTIHFIAISLHLLIDFLLHTKGFGFCDVIQRGLNCMMSYKGVQNA
jgi:hypothetical protein